MDLVRASLSAILGQLPWMSAWFCLALTLMLGERRLASQGNPRAPVYWAGVVAAAALGLWLAYGVLWLCDDAYISFRYARNFAQGHGLVFNVGEWVEGYTNFLWTLLLGIAGWLGADIPLWGLFGNLAAFVLALVFVGAAIRRASPQGAMVPFAVLALAASRPFHTFASSGLETMPAAALVAAGLWASTFRHGALWSGLALTLAALARPDHVQLYGCLGIALVGEDILHNRGRPLLRRLDLRRALSYAAPFLLIYVPYFLWRWHAYGDFFPNTYYAKSGGDPYYRQGIVYLGHFFWTTGAWAFLPILGVALIARPRHRDETRFRLFAVLALPLFIHYVVRVGGDFMEHRFFISLLPIVAVALETSLRWQLHAATNLVRKTVWLLAGALGVAATMIPVRVLKPWEKRWHLADEASFYRVNSVFPLEIASGYAEKGRRLRAELVERGITPPIAGDSIGLLGYHSELPIVDAFGLVNRRFAHKPIEKRGRPGHEKFATLDELIEEGALIDTRGNPWREFGPLAEVRVGSLSFHLLRWEPTLVDALSKLPGAHLPHPADRLQDLLETSSRGELVEVMEFYRDFLERTPERDTILEPLRERLAEVADFEGGLPEGASVQGSFEVATGRLPRGASGTGWAIGREGSVLQIPLPSLRKRLRLVAAGGAGATIELEVDGEVVRQDAPQQSRRLAPIAWSLTEYEGRPGILWIRNGSREPLLVDAIHWGAPENEPGQKFTASDLSRAIRAWRQAEEVLPAGDPDLHSIRERVAHRWTLEGGTEDLEFEGEAFGRGAVTGAVGRQSPIRGIQGMYFLNSMHGGDGSTGKVFFPPFEIPTEPIHLLVGGGRDCTKVYVGLEVDGRIVSKVCGKNDETLRPAILSTRRFAGQIGRIVAVDQASGGWGHILVDDVIVPRPVVGMER